MRASLLVPAFGSLLVACGVAGAPSAPALPSPDASTTIAAPLPSTAVPSGASGTTPRSAVAFVRYYYEQLGEALVTLDSSTIRPLFAASCTPCVATADSIDEEKASGRRYSGGGITVRVAEARALDAQNTAVTTVLDIDPVILQTGPSAPSPLPSRDGVALDVRLVRKGDWWLVARVLPP